MTQFSLNAFNAASNIAKKYDAKFSVITCLAKENISAWYVYKEMHTQIIEDAKKFATSFIPKLENYVKNTGVSQSVSVI